MHRYAGFPRRHARRVAVALVACALLLGLLPVPSPITAALTPATAEPGGLRASIAFQAPEVNHVSLGALASRTRGADHAVSASGIGPFTITGTDAGGDPYSFTSDLPYGPDPLPFDSPDEMKFNAVEAGWAMEGEERPLDPPENAAFTGTYDEVEDEIALTSSGNCAGGDGSYCSVFGPEVYSEPFTIPADDGRDWAVSFNWRASGQADNYEIYGFLVKVVDHGGGVVDYGTDESHTLLAYGRGHVQGWTTASAPVTEPGTYRFRFVNGTYDGTGGLAVGSRMFIRPAVVIGLDNPINFPVIDDAVLEPGQTIELDADAPADNPVTYTSTTTDVCTVAGTTVTVVDVGRCTVVADHDGDTDHAPATSVTRSFTVLSDPIAPSNNGRPTFIVDEDAGEHGEATADDGSWANGGSAITSTDYQWQATIDGDTTDIDRADEAVCVLEPQDGATLSLQVTKTNAVGSTSATSTQTLAGYTCKPAAVVVPTPPSGATPVPKPSSSDTKVPTTTQTPRGPLKVTFEGVTSTEGSGSGDGDAGSLRVVTTAADNGTDTWDRGVTAVSDRFGLSADDFTFTAAEVCVPYDPAAFDAQGRPMDRLRLLHTHDGVERDITTHINTESTPPTVCGNTDHFSDFQVVVYAGDRNAGANRYATAAAVALDLYPDGAPVVYVATGQNHPDAVAAGLSAAAADAPLLLVQQGDVPAATTAAIQSLGPDRIVVVGGTKAVAPSVLTQLGTGGAEVTRVSGPDRYSTAADLARADFPGGVDTVYLMTGRQFADALTGGASAHRDGAAILLTEPTGLPAVTAAALTDLAPDRVVIVGGTAAISASVATTVGGLVPSVERIGGADRYETAALLAEDRSGGTIVSATGLDFADALVSTTVAARYSGPILLVAGNEVPDSVRDRVMAIAPASLVVVGGEKATGPQAELILTRLLPKTAPASL